MNQNTVQDLIKIAAASADHTKVQEGGNHVIPAGKTYGRFIGYVELGKQKQRAFQGKEKPDADSVRLTFEFLQSKNIRTISVDGKDVQLADRIDLVMTISTNEKSKFYKLFQKMRRGRAEITHMAQMLGEAFSFDVTHNEGTNGKVYANISDNGGWNVSAPMAYNVATESDEPVQVREAISPLRIFLFNNPTLESWNSLFIDGERTVKDEKGNDVKRSNNFIQNSILSASNFRGSAVEAMLLGADSLPDMTKVEAPTLLDESPDNTEFEGATKQAAPVANTPSADDVLASMGLK